MPWQFTHFLIVHAPRWLMFQRLIGHRVSNILFALGAVVIETVSHPSAFRRKYDFHSANGDVPLAKLGVLINSLTWSASRMASAWISATSSFTRANSSGVASRLDKILLVHSDGDFMGRSFGFSRKFSRAFRFGFDELFAGVEILVQSFRCDRAVGLRQFRVGRRS
jgi:hypothetical protein